jgi:hypothetical protein
VIGIGKIAPAIYSNVVYPRPVPVTLLVLTR